MVILENNQLVEMAPWNGCDDFKDGWDCLMNSGFSKEEHDAWMKRHCGCCPFSYDGGYSCQIDNIEPKSRVQEIKDHWIEKALRKGGWSVLWGCLRGWY